MLHVTEVAWGNTIPHANSGGFAGNMDGGQVPNFVLGSYHFGLRFASVPAGTR
jgi:hypothetical protein